MKAFRRSGYLLEGGTSGGCVHEYSEVRDGDLSLLYTNITGINLILPLI